MAAMNDMSEMLRAVYRKDLLALQQLTPGAVNSTDADGRSLLMHAVLTEDADPEIVRLLIERGANVNACDRQQRWTALHFAARDQNAALVRVLLEGGAQVDPVDTFGNTPLWRSVMNVGADLGAIAVLIAHGANPRKKNHHDKEPMELASDTGRKDIVELFENAEQGHRG